ncbi:MAG: hypothetical protein ORO03_05395, partial [Alphaproteobacteria bacterium]|nr:hypothetical protein [Alphaproteobacteria bacterium]
LGIGSLFGASAMSGSLVLVANGPRFGLPFNGQPKFASLLLTAGLSTGVAGDGRSNLTLIQTGDTVANGIDIEGVAVTAGGNLTLSAIGSAANYGLWLDSTSLRAGGAVLVSQAGTSAFNSINLVGVNLAATDLSLVQTGIAGTEGIASLNLVANLTGNLTVTSSGFAGDNGINLTSSILNVGGAASLESSGTAGFSGVDLNDTRLRTEGDLNLVQSGKAAFYGIISSGSTLAAGGDLNGSQSGQSGLEGMIFDLGSLSAAGDLTLTQSGSSLGNGITAAGLDFKAGGNLSLVQRGTIGSGASGIVFGIEPLVASGGIKGVGLAAGPNGLVTLSTNNQPLTLKNGDDFAVTGGRLRLDLGGGGLVSSGGQIPAGGYSLAALGRDVYFTGATSGNSAQIHVGDGSFTFVNDQRLVTTLVTLNDNTTATTPGSGWGSGLGTLASGTASGGLTVINNGPVSSINNQTAIFGGPVMIDGVTSGAAHLLTYIEGSTIIVSGAPSSFAANLTLVASGSGSESGIKITTGLSTGVANDGTSALILRQTGTVSGGGIVITGSSVTAGGDLSLEQTGIAGANGIKLDRARLVAGGALSLSQSGTVGTVSVAILVTASSLLANSEIAIQQSTAGSAAGIGLEATGRTASDSVALTAGAGKSISLQTLNRNLALVGFDGFDLVGGSLAIKLGSGQLVSVDSAGAAIASPGFTIHAAGAAVVLSGATSGNRAILAVGSGAFTFASNLTDQTAPATITNDTSLADLGLATVAFGGTVGNRTVAGLTVTGSQDAALTGLGVLFGGTVTIDGVQTGAAKNLSYIEGKGVGVFGSASSFAGSLTLVSNGSGITDASGDNAGGILVETNLTAGVSDDGVSNLSLVQSGRSLNNGIAIAASSLRAGGNIFLRQAGSIDAGFVGIVLLARGVESARGSG